MSGAKYEGATSPDKLPHGQGTLILKISAIRQKEYRGNWVNGFLLQNQAEKDLECAEAVLIDSQGIYVGEVLDGKPHGLGKMQEVNGNQYDGNFMFGLRHGEGCYSIRPSKGITET